MRAEDWILRSIRSTRSEPPALAADDPLRRGIYLAGLEQFEQLLNSAEIVGPAARPLPLFYALSQASRAIVAARGDDPEIDGHGLAEDRHHEPPDLLHRRIKRTEAKDGRDAFGALSRATESPDFTGSIDLGALWAALPDTHRFPEKSWLPDWRGALDVMDETNYRGKDGEIQVQVMSFSGNPHKDEISTLRGRYPNLPDDTKVGLKSAGSELGAGNWIVVMTWSAENELDDVAPGTASDESSRHLLPTLPGQKELLSELMSWWALLFGLSIFARYHPAMWRRALNVDRSPLAVPLEAILDKAQSAIPALVGRELWI